MSIVKKRIDSQFGTFPYFPSHSTMNMPLIEMRTINYMYSITGSILCDVYCSTINEIFNMSTCQHTKIYAPGIVIVSARFRIMNTSN